MSAKRPTGSLSFSALPTTIRGDIGEQIMFDYLLSKGWHVYPHLEGLPAPVDCMAIKPKPGGFNVVGFEAKTYPRRYSSNQTGIDERDYYTYLEIIKTIPLTIFFIDPFEQLIYLLPFARHYDKAVFESGKAYFDLEYCTPEKDLTRAELGQISWEPSTYYKNIQKFF